MAILIVEQKVKEVLHLADRTYVLRLGKVALKGDAQNILKEEKYRKIFCNYLAVHFAITHTSVIPVPTIGGYRNLLTKCGDSGIPLRYSRNDEPCLNSYNLFNIINCQ